MSRSRRSGVVNYDYQLDPNYQRRKGSRRTSWWLPCLLLELVIVYVSGEYRPSLLLVASCLAASPWMIRSIRSKIGCDFLSSRTCLISCRNWSGWSTKFCASCSGPEQWRLASLLRLSGREQVDLPGASRG